MKRQKFYLCDAVDRRPLYTHDNLSSVKNCYVEMCEGAKETSR